MIYAILILIIIILSYLVYILNNKNNIYENFIYERRFQYNQLLNKIRELDSKEIFEKDDEVGVTFSEIKSEIEEFKKFLE